VREVADLGTYVGFGLEFVEEALSATEVLQRFAALFVVD
jgi:hypothetical protein